MNSDTLMQLLVAAHQLCGHRDYAEQSATLQRLADLSAP
jgi:hypothetical protein